MEVTGYVLISLFVITITAVVAVAVAVGVRVVKETLAKSESTPEIDQDLLDQ